MGRRRTDPDWPNGLRLVVPGRDGSQFGSVSWLFPLSTDANFPTITLELMGHGLRLGLGGANGAGAPKVPGPDLDAKPQDSPPPANMAAGSRLQAH